MINKLKILILFSLFSLLVTSSTYAAVSPTPKPSGKAPTPTSSTIQQQINSLTNKIASRVAQLKLVEKRGVIGKVTDVSNTQITIEDGKNNTKFIDVDEFTKFTSPSSKTSFGISDIKKGDHIGALGLYNKDSRRILARFIEVLTIPRVIHGGISSVDAKNFTIAVASDDGKDYTVDIQSSTRTFLYDQETRELVKGGFTKLEEGQSVILVGFPDTKDEKLIEATRVIVLPGIPTNPKIKLSVSSKTSAPTSTP